MENRYEEIMALLRSIQFGMAKMMYRFVKPFNISPPQARTLMTLVELGGDAKMSALAGAAEMPNSNASNICERLFKAGLVERTQSESDRREVRVRLTETGKELLRRMRGSYEEVRDSALGKLDESELHAVATLLSKLDESIKSANGEQETLSGKQVKTSD